MGEMPLIFVWKSGRGIEESLLERGITLWRAGLFSNRKREL
jgi:hypothetical protein